MPLESSVRCGNAQCSLHQHRTVGTNPVLYLGTICKVCLICQPLDFSAVLQVPQKFLKCLGYKVRNHKVGDRLGYIRHKSKESRLPFSKDASHSSYSLYEKKNNMGICNYKAQNSFFRRKNMIHTSKDAQATAAVCSCGPNPWKSKLRDPAVGSSERWTLFLLLYSSIQVRKPLCEARSKSAQSLTCTCADLQVTDQVKPPSLACSHPSTRLPASRLLVTHLAGGEGIYGNILFFIEPSETFLKLCP